MRAVLCVVLTLLFAAPAVAQQSKPKKPEDKAFIEGKLIRQDNQEPVGRQWITLRSKRWSRSTSTDTFGKFRFEKVPAALDYTISFYHSGYKVRQFGPFEVAKDRELQVGTLEAIAVDPQVAPYTYSDTYLPGQNITVMVRSIRATDVNVDVFKIPTAELEAQRSALIDRKRLSIQNHWKPLLSYRQPISGGHALRWRTTKVEPAFSDAGFYVVRVAGAGVSKLIPIFVTKLSLITKRTPNETWVWATDLESGEPRKGVKVFGEGTDKKDTPPASLLKQGNTRKDGLYRLTGGHTKNVRYWGILGDSIAYVDTVPASAAQSLKFRTYVYTERPAYRPNDQVFYKVIARANDGGAYRVNPGEKWTIAVRDPEGNVVHRGSHKANLFGTFDGDFTLGDSPALGTWTVEARADDKVQSGRFKVLEYRKPEYKLSVSTPREQYVQGTDIEVHFQASYYFGAPLKGQTVMWTVFETPFRPWWYDSYYGAYEDSEVYGYGRVARSGQVTLDAKGHGVVKLGVDKASIDRWVTVEAVVTDATNRQVTAKKRVMVTRGTFRLGIRPNGKIFKVGETARFDIDATEFDGAGSKRPVKVTASLETFSAKHKIWIYRTLDAKPLETNAAGKAVYKFPIQRDGFIRVEVAGKDKYGNPIVESSFIWATKNATIAGGYKKKSLDILPDKRSYEPGDTARVLVNTTRPNAWVLFTIEGDGVFEPKVVKVDGNSRLFDVKLTARHAPNTYVSVAFAADKSFYSLSKSLAVSPAHRLLSVKVKSDKRVYKPKSTARYTIEVKDRAGKPVEAELSVGLVDAAVYAISQELAPNVGSFFYGDRPNPVRTAYSFPSRYLGGADKDGEEDGDGGVRRDFKDTAFWKAVVRTNAQGIAEVDVPLPDNLTTWRLTVRAVSKETLVGQTTHEMRTAKDLMSTLALPRFFRKGDHVEVVGMIHNQGEDLSGVVAKLEVVRGGATIASQAARELGSMSGATTKALRWAVDIPDATGDVAFRISVQGGTLRDAEERSVPVYPVSVDRLIGVSGMSGSSTSQEFEIPEGTVAGTEGLSVRLSPTLAGAVVESLEDLARYPYGCVEQTMNSFLPDLVADKALKSMGMPRSGKLKELPAMVRKGLRQLYSMQHSDGGWGWWNDDPSHPYLTAYAVYGLSRAKRLGWDVRDHALRRGVVAAMKQFKGAADPNTRAFIAYAVAHSELTPQTTKFLHEALPKIIEHEKLLNSYSVATLVLTYVAMGKMDDARAWADKLGKRAVVGGDVAHFPGRAWHYTWTDNAKEATAYAVRALLAARPDSPLVPKAVRWLMVRRRGGMWDTTKDTAAAVEALVALMETTNELDSQYTARLLVNGKSIGSMTVTPGTVMSSGIDLPVPKQYLQHGKNRLEVQIEGKGTLYWTGRLHFGAPPVPRKNGIGVTREYFKVVRTTVKKQPKVDFVRVDRGNVNIGDEVEVRLTLYPDKNYEYVAVEDPLPAGYEVIPTVSARGYTRREVRDEKVAFFMTRVSDRKLTMSYRLRAEMAGLTTAAPAVAWLMYMPELMGNSSKDALPTHSGADTAAR